MSTSGISRAYWCDHCQVPVLGKHCYACGGSTRDISAATFVPIFRSELSYLKKQYLSEKNQVFRELETWVNTSNRTYFFQGTRLLRLSQTKADIEIPDREIDRKFLRRSKNDFLSKLKEANRFYIEEMQYEAENFI